MPKPSRSKAQTDYTWNQPVEFIFTRGKQFNRHNGRDIFDAVKARIEIKNLLDMQGGVIIEFFSSFGLKISDLDDEEPKQKEAKEPVTQLETDAVRHPEDAAKLQGHLTFYTDHLRCVIKDISEYPNSSEELQNILNANGYNTNPSTDLPNNQTSSNSEEVSMEVTEESQTEPSPTDETFKLPPKHLTFRGQTQDTITLGPETNNQFTPLSNMYTTNSEAIPEQEKRFLPFFITPNGSWSETCKFLTPSVESLNISLSKGHFLKLSVNSE
ncbi:hypothetical protein CEXT_710971 [Caerostris extrusa]|uniref:Uncharacterized protein n=1 Tax=Caerostris extrusa TaxID=172846 RepID=A0AAV4TL65_CAEEX|nr:hypothetical protein CEXT_710971 [Caerostris extrusa]